MKYLLGFILVFAGQCQVGATDYEYKVYFGMQMQTGPISETQWAEYEKGFAQKFTGFTRSSATGYYKGAQEPSRVITIFMDECREPLLQQEAQRYAKIFDQQSVLIAKTALVTWQSVGQKTVEPMDDTCALSD